MMIKITSQIMLQGGRCPSIHVYPSNHVIDVPFVPSTLLHHKQQHYSLSNTTQSKETRDSDGDKCQEGRGKRVREQRHTRHHLCWPPGGVGRGCRRVDRLIRSRLIECMTQLDAVMVHTHHI